MTTDFGQIGVGDPATDRHQSRQGAWRPTCRQGDQAIKADEAADKAMAEDLLTRYAVQLGLKSPETRQWQSDRRISGRWPTRRRKPDSTARRRRSRRLVISSSRTAIREPGSQSQHFCGDVHHRRRVDHVGVRATGKGIRLGRRRRLARLAGQAGENEGGFEAPDAAVSTVQEYNYVPSAKLRGEGDVCVRAARR